MSGLIRVCTEALDTATARWVLSRTDLAAGRLTVYPHGDGHHEGLVQILGDLLDALGVTGPQRLVGRAHQSVLAYTLPWLLAYGIRDVLVHRHDRCSDAAIELLADLTAAAGARLWLTGPTGDAGRADMLAGRGAVTVTWAQVREHFAATPGGAPRPVPDRPVWPEVPADDFPTFRAAMRRTLTAAQFAEADELYLATVAEARARLAGPLSGEGTLAARQPGGRLPVLDREILERVVAAYLHTLIGRSQHRSDLTVRIRAAQTAAFTLGWFMQVKLDRLVATTSAPPVQAATSQQTWEVMRLYREPHVGAVLVLAALGCDIDTIRTLPTSAVAPSGAAITVHGAPLPTPPGADVLLRAQLIAGQLTGRGPDAPFAHAFGEEMTQVRVQNILRIVHAEVGIPMLTRHIDRTWGGHEWLTRWGVMLQDLS